MTEAATIRVGVVGLGFMGRTHIQAYEAAQRDGFPCCLAAVCDQDADRRGGQPAGVGNIPITAESGLQPFRSEDVRIHEDASSLLADPDIDLVSICTYTDTHVPLAIAALEAGKHVLVEKPVALCSTDVERLMEVSRRHAALICMPGMCMRYWPGWFWLKDMIDRRTFGGVRSAVFARHCAPPDWAPSFYADPTRSGGAIIDLHIHDADFVRWCFGDPFEVVSTGSHEHVTTFYRYASGPAHVVAEGAWVPVKGFPFRMTYSVVFDEAAAEFDSSQDRPLTLSRAGRREALPVDPLTGYEFEIRDFLEVVGRKRQRLTVSLEDALHVTRLLEAEQLSLRERRAVRFATV
jgi:predicted dehydrogenase